MPYIGKQDPKGNPVRLAKKTGHVSNYDESKVPEYSLPDPLKTSDGRDVTSAGEWQARRAEILQFYEEQIYGRIPKNAPVVQWQVAQTENDSRNGTAITKRIEGAVGDGTAVKLRLTLHLPKKAGGPVSGLAEPFVLRRRRPGRRTPRRR